MSFMIVTGVKIDYLLLQSVLIVMSIILGIKLISRTGKSGNRKYWFYSIAYILLFAIIEGLRYGRGIDYLHYEDLYVNAFDESNMQDVVFTSLNRFLNILGVPVCGAFILYSALWCFSIFFFLRSFRNIIWLALPLFIIISLPNFECLIRQYFAFSFFLISFSFWGERKKFLFSFFALLSCLSHIAMLFPLLLCVILGPLKFPFNAKYAILIYLFLSYFFDYSSSGGIVNYISLLNLNGNYSYYIQNSDMWLGEEAVRTELQRGYMGKLAATFFDCSIFYLSYEKMIKEEHPRFIVLIYNIVIISSLYMQAVMGVEIMRRLVTPLLCLHSILIAYVIEEKFFRGIIVSYYKYKVIIVLYVLIVLAGKYIYASPGQAYIGDKGKYTKTLQVFQ